MANRTKRIPKREKKKKKKFGWKPKNVKIPVKRRLAQSHGYKNTSAREVHEPKRGRQKSTRQRMTI